ncbi:MAG: nitroreductase family protein, partial [candidate division Zixibacteria bacterium]|nr:nitroreductase family protein [candidate division Zixibacteria bacterium]
MSDQETPSHHGPGEQPDRSYPNETMRLLLERSSCRSFTDLQIPPEVLASVIDAGVHSPTAGNLQPYSIIKIENENTRRRLAGWCNQDFIGQAPTNLLFCLDFRRLKQWAKLQKAPFTANNSFRHFWMGFQDTIIAAQNICTAADAMELGAVYIGTIIESIAEIRQLCNLPEHVFPVVLLCLGYPKQRPQPRKKLDRSIVVHNEKYSEIDDDRLLAAFNEKYSGIKLELTDERMQNYREVCRNVGGEDFAAEAVAKLTEQGY